MVILFCNWLIIGICIGFRLGFMVGCFVLNGSWRKLNWCWFIWRLVVRRRFVLLSGCGLMSCGCFLRVSVRCFLFGLSRNWCIVSGVIVNWLCYVFFMLNFVMVSGNWWRWCIRLFLLVVV